MSCMKEKVAYLHGLADGLEIKDEAVAKLFAAMIETMDAMADTIDENELSLAELDECVDDLYDALDELEDQIDLCECHCGEDAFDEDDFIEIECPHCGETVYFDEDMLETPNALICPNCNGDVITDLDEDEEGDD